MSQFEYLTAFLSLVQAFAVSRILAGLGSVIRERDRIEFYWVHVAWMILAILGVCQIWWTMWGFRSSEVAHFPQFIAYVLPSFLFVLVAYLVVPEPGSTSHLDLRQYYFDHRKWLFGLLAVSLVSLALSRVALGHDRLLGPQTGLRLIAASIAAYLGTTDSRRIHATAVILVYVLYFMSVGVMMFRSAQ